MSDRVGVVGLGIMGSAYAGHLLDAGVAVNGFDVEIVTARAESYESYSRKPYVVAASLRDDAFRRDFTINTLMENLHSGEVLDHTGRAHDDLAAGVIKRVVLMPIVIMIEIGILADVECALRT